MWRRRRHRARPLRSAPPPGVSGIVETAVAVVVVSVVLYDESVVIVIVIVVVTAAGLLVDPRLHLRHLHGLHLRQLRLGARAAVSSAGHRRTSLRWRRRFGPWGGLWRRRRASDSARCL